MILSRYRLEYDKTLPLLSMIFEFIYIEQLRCLHLLSSNSFFFLFLCWEEKMASSTCSISLVQAFWRIQMEQPSNMSKWEVSWIYKNFIYETCVHSRSTFSIERSNHFSVDQLCVYREYFIYDLSFLLILELISMLIFFKLF